MGNPRQAESRMKMMLFALQGSRPLGEEIARALGQSLAPHEERAFEDGEHKSRPLADPRGADAYVIHSLYGEPACGASDKLLRLLFFIATLRDHGAARVTAVVPYLAYGRKDRQTKPFDPVSVRYTAQLFEAVGTEALITLEAHNVAALQNAFRIRTVHLEGHDLFAARAVALAGREPVVVASPDPGGIKRAQLAREAYEQRLGRAVGFAFVDKRRSGGVVSGGTVVAGDVDGATVLLVDDLISTGGTMARAAAALLGAGARQVHAFAAHGLFVEDAAAVLADPPIGRIVVSESVPPLRLEGSATRARLEIVPTAPLVARAIRACHGAPG
jgi:ribose-phosphate pyrophosphokinase